MTAENNAGLSPEELAALDDENDEATADDSDEEAETDTETEASAEADDTADADTETEAAAGAEEETPAVEEADAPAAPVSQSSDFQAKLASREVPDDIDSQIEAANADIAALDKKLEEGEIDYTDHIKSNRELLDKRTELVTLKREADFVAEQNEATATQQWNWEQARFVEDNTEFQSPVLHGALSGVLQTLYADEANADKSYRWFLNEAGRQVREAFGRTEAPKPADPAPDTVTAEEAKAAKEAAAAAKKSGAKQPQTLAAVPAASETTSGADPFAAVDNLTGMELEEALAKMGKADSDKYLRA